MTRRARSLFLLAALAPACSTVDRPSARPNILLILADDLGYGDPRCYNADSRIATPHIDRLAREGMLFTDAHAPGSLCVPSRYGLLTGRYPCRRGALRPGREAVLEPDRATLASLLRGCGYTTAMVGKWHLGFDGGLGPDRDWSVPLRGGPVDRGFDSWFGIPASLDIPPYFYVRGRAPLAPPNERIAASQSDGWTKIQGAFWRTGAVAPGFDHAEVLPRFAREATAFLDARSPGQAPFFLYVALTAPHTPWLPREAFAGRSGAGAYGDFVMDVDDTVGRLLAALDRNGLAEDTLVVFASDNGPVWYPADADRFAHRSVGPLRGMKADAWEGGHRVPFLARWPGVAAAGSVTAQTVCFTDLMATFAEIVGAAVPEGVGDDSVSLVPVLCGTASAPVREVTVLKANATVVRQGKWKLITHLGSGGFSRPGRVAPLSGQPAGQLYDLEQDLGETTNLWARHPGVVERLEEALRAQLRETPRASQRAPREPR